MVRFRFEASDGTAVIFREPRPGDERQLMQYINEIIDEPMSGLVMDKHVTLREERRWLKDRLKEIAERETVMLLVESGGMIRGNCSVSLRRWKEAHRGNIGIAITKELRGKGIGEALMAKTMDLAEKRMKGLEMFDLAVFGYNKRAIAMYEKLGFVSAGRIPDAAKEEGRIYTDDVKMYLRVKDRR